MIKKQMMSELAEEKNLSSIFEVVHFKRKFNSAYKRKRIFRCRFENQFNSEPK